MGESLSNKNARARGVTETFGGKRESFDNVHSRFIIRAAVSMEELRARGRGKEAKIRTKQNESEDESQKPAERKEGLRSGKSLQFQELRFSQDKVQKCHIYTLTQKTKGAPNCALFAQAKPATVKKMRPSGEKSQ